MHFSNRWETDVLTGEEQRNFKSKISELHDYDYLLFIFRCHVSSIKHFKTAFFEMFYG